MTFNNSINETLQIKALVDLYNTTNGGSWTNNSGWDIFISNATYSPEKSLTFEQICSKPPSGINCTNTTITSNSSPITVISHVIMSQNGLTGTIDSTFCNLLAFNIIQLKLNHNKLYGTLPHCFLSILSNKYLTSTTHSVVQLSYNNLNGTLSCNYNTSTVADANMSQNKALTMSHNQFTGTIPDCLTSDAFVAVDLSFNQLEGEIPSNWYASYMVLHQNCLNGTIPSNLIAVNQSTNTSYKDAMVIGLHYNDFTGTVYLGSMIEDILQLLTTNGSFFISLNNNKIDYLNLDMNEINISSKYSNTTYGSILLNDNSITNSNIGDILDTLFAVNNVTYQHLTFSNNPDLTGYLQNWKTPAPQELEIFTLHSCDIGGRLPSKNGFLTNTQYVTMYNNHLSCDIPTNFLNYQNDSDIDSSNYTSYILLGNLFGIKHLSKTDLLTHEPFTTASTLYIDNHAFNETFREIATVSFLLFAACIFVVTLAIKCKFKQRCCDLKKLILRFWYAGDNNAFEKHLKHNYNKYNNNGMGISYDFSRTATWGEVKSVKATMVIENLSDNDTVDLNYRKFEERTNYTIANSKFYDKLRAMFSSWFLLFVCVGLCLLYYLSNNYYACGHIISQPAITYYAFDAADDEGNGKIVAVTSQTCVALLVGIFYGVIILYLQMFINMTTKIDDDNTSDIVVASNYKKKLKNQKSEHFIPLLSIDEQSQHIRNDDIGAGGIRESANVDLEVKLEDGDEKNDDKDETDLNSFGKYNLLQIGFDWIRLLAIYIIANLLSVANIIFDTLPNDNNINIDVDNVWIQYIVLDAPAIVISMASIFIVPNLVDITSKLLFIICQKCDCYGHNHCACTESANQITHHRSYLILLFRSIVTVVVPFVTALIMLPQCGNNWTLLWRKCSDKDTFEQNHSIQFNSVFFEQVSVELSSYDAICNSKSIGDLVGDSRQLNKCIRSFLDVWTPTICVKLLLYTFALWILYFFKKYDIANILFGCTAQCLNQCICCKRKGCDKKKLLHCYTNFIAICNCKKTKKSIDEKKVLMKFEDKSFDSEYASLATKLELFFIFMPFIPFILPIIVLALYSNFSVFCKVIHDLKCQRYAGAIDQKLRFKKEQNIQFWQRFPFKALFGSVVFGQSLFIAITYDIFDNWLHTTFIAVVATMDVLFILLNVRPIRERIVKYIRKKRIKLIEI